MFVKGNKIVFTKTEIAVKIGGEVNVCTQARLHLAESINFWILCPAV